MISFNDDIYLILFLTLTITTVTIEMIFIMMIMIMIITLISLSDIILIINPITVYVGFILLCGYWWPTLLSDFLVTSSIMAWRLVFY